jgi:hypothetical protein
MKMHVRFGAVSGGSMIERAEAVRLRGRRGGELHD